MLFPCIAHIGTLLSRLHSKPPSSLKRRWEHQIGKSLQALHERGIVWGDAKADNVLIDADDNAWIVDFGGGYTLGWVNRDKAGTIEGDCEGMANISRILL